MTSLLLPPRLRTPGLPGRGVEQHRVQPGQLVALELAAGDEVTIVDLDGRQPAELTLLGGARPGSPAGGTPAGLGALERATVLPSVPAPVAAALRGRGLDPAEAGAVQLFDPAGPAGDAVAFVADRPLTAVLAVPARRMEPDAQDPPTAVLLRIQHAQRSTAEERPLPPPLAAPLFEVRIDASTAVSYEVPAGCYVQVIDVEGRQCSDFLAFDARRLQAGVEHGLDLTATRTMSGRAMPTPGLHGKFHGPDLQPLLEVVRDTVGRHDAFSLACNRRYYEDVGYPGHVNCTDNFNAELRRFGVAARSGWAGLNLFYNTFLDAAERLFLDEPWSRPGDHVLLRAMADLVCATSACPDDISPANGWEPTPVHVRVYPAERPFSAAVARRTTADAPPVLTRKTGFAERTTALSRHRVEYRGYWLPAEYDGYGLQAEYWACRERVAVMDLSPLRKFEVTGPDAEALLQATLTRDVRRLATGQVSYTALCTESGGMVDDGTVFRMGPDAFRFIGGDDADGVWLRERATALGLDRVWVRPSTDALHNLAVQGPMSRQLLDGLLWTPPDRTPLAELRWFRFTVGRLGGPTGTPVVVSRTGYSGELGYEVFCHPDDGTAVWDAIWAAGVPLGIAPLGLDALDVLRIESGLAFAGYEFDEEVDPFEAGIGFCVPLKSKADDFVGRAALERRSAHPSRVLVGLELAGNEPAGHGDRVHVGRAAVGVVTSGTRSPILRRTIALCRLAPEYAAPGTAVEIGKLDGQQKRIPATVVRFPFFDPEKVRPRS